VLKKYLQQYLGSKDLPKILKENIHVVETSLLIDIMKILQEELKKRIDDFEKQKDKNHERA